MTRRGVLTGTGAVLALVAIAALVVWYVVLPQHRPSLRDGERLGIDVSRHQNDIDWVAVAGDDIEFAVIKATEGGDWVDPLFEENWREAKAAGLDVSAYHFFRTCTDGALQAQNFLDTVPAENDLPLAIDVEGDSRCEQRVSDARVRAEFEEMLEIVEAERGDVMLYVLEGFTFLEDLTEERPRWQRSILNRPATDDWLLWQYSFVVEVDGIDGGVDLNVEAAPTGG